MAEPILQLAGVGKCYTGLWAIRDVDLDLQRGESLALLGHNGAGKTTLIKLMLGLARPTAGRLRVDGRDPAARTSRRDNTSLGYLPENIAFDPALSGQELLRFFARLKGVPAQECDGLLERVGLAEAARRRLHTYSKGMRQRLGLAQALLGEPVLLFLDEPTTGLDPQLRREFYELVAERRAAGCTILISTHALGEIEAHTQKIAIMNQGRLVACGTLKALQAEAGLPVKMRISTEPGQTRLVAERVSGPASLEKVNDRTVELTCPNGRKMETVRLIGNAGDSVLDVDIMPPRLEDIYAHFGDGGRPL